MSRQHTEINPEIAAWIQEQHLFFVSTAPLAAEGHINTSPKGLDCLRILGPHQVAYLDLTGSGAETIAHLRENGRILFMFCALSGLPKIVRLHGKGEVITPSSERWQELRALFPAFPGVRSIIHAEIERVSDSCGYGVPKFDFVEERDVLQRWADKQGPQGVLNYRNNNNRSSIDGLPSLAENEIPAI